MEAMEYVHALAQPEGEFKRRRGEVMPNPGGFQNRGRLWDPKELLTPVESRPTSLPPVVEEMVPDIGGVGDECFILSNTVVFGIGVSGLRCYMHALGQARGQCALILRSRLFRSATVWFSEPIVAKEILKLVFSAFHHLAVSLSVRKVSAVR
jgi:hypothetical protein